MPISSRGGEVSVAFLLTSLIVVASPGTGVLYTLTSALKGGRRAAVAASVGCTLGIVPAMLAAMVGLAAVLHTSALAFSLLKWLGVGYLLYMAWQQLGERGALSVETRPDAPVETRVVLRGFLVNILNPKLSIFFLAFLPQFIPADEAHPVARMLELSATFMLMTFVVFVLYGLFAARLRDHVVSRPRVMTWLHRAFAGGFALLGVKLAFAER
jgi:threonine/homoserine/homoserine lactone efflux protein